MFLKLFLICTFKDPNLANNFDKFDGKPLKKIQLLRVHGVCFFPSLSGVCVYPFSRKRGINFFCDQSGSILFN